MKILIIILTSIVFVGCAAINQSTMKRTALVNPGMDKEKVLEILGTPGNRQFKGKDEAWQYCQTSVWGTTDKFVVIWFYDGKVTGMNTYTQSQVGMCDSFFKTVNWEDAPDKTIEFRGR